MLDMCPECPGCLLKLKNVVLNISLKPSQKCGFVAATVRVGRSCTGGVQMRAVCVQNGLVATPPVPEAISRNFQNSRITKTVVESSVQNISATAGLSVNDNLNQMSLMLFENFIKR
jgi:hypothetical protein